MKLLEDLHTGVHSWVNGSKLFCIVVLVGLSSISASAQEKGSISWGIVATEAEKTAVRLLVDQTKNLGDVYVVGPNYIFDLTPDIKIETGSEDAFDGVIAKLTGNFLLFRTTTTAEGIEIPDGRFFSVVPISAGIETNRSFDNINLIVEAGYVPWYWNPTATNVPWIIRQTRAAIFIQGGYKFSVSDSIDMNMSGGSEDESEEEPDSGLFRLKASGKFSPKKMLSKSLGVSVVGASDVWYDVANSEVYYKVEATFKVILPYDLSFDFSYQKSSGAPNFNQGDQFSANLTVAF